MERAPGGSVTLLRGLQSHSSITKFHRINKEKVLNSFFFPLSLSRYKQLSQYLRLFPKEKRKNFKQKEDLKSHC